MLYGTDAVVTEILEAAGVLASEDLPTPGGCRIFPSAQAIAPKSVLLTGTVPLGDLGYGEIREFARKSLENSRALVGRAHTLILTLHGVGFGLDETEVFESEIAGILDAVEAGNYPDDLQSIKIVERNAGRARRLDKALVSLFPSRKIALPGSLLLDEMSAETTETLKNVGYESSSKPFIFVAMPFDAEMDDIFHYGIRGPIREAGYLCERADELIFSGDVMERVKDRISKADYVVADLTGANPNVYLEVGYAWGLGRPTVLIVQESQSLKFDVRGQRCLVYQRILDLEVTLKKELLGLSGS